MQFQTAQERNAAQVQNDQTEAAIALAKVHSAERVAASRVLKNDASAAAELA